MRNCVRGKSIIGALLVLLALIWLPAGAVGQTPENFVWLTEVNVANGESFVYPINIHNAVPLLKAVIPLRFTLGDDIHIDSISFVGSRFNPLALISSSVDNVNHKLNVVYDGLLERSDEKIELPAGDGMVAAVYLTVDQNASTQDVDVDSTTYPPGVFYQLLDNMNIPIDDGLVPGLIHITTRRPAIHLDPTEFFFTTVVGVNPVTQTLHVTNIGEDPLNWDITYKPSWLNVSIMNGTAPSDVDLMPDVSGLAIGSYFDSIAVHDEFADPKKVWAFINLTIQEELQPDLGGVVQEPGGDPISGAIVEVWDDFPGGSILYTMTTGGDGTFAFFGVPAGGYEIYAYRDGYYPSSVLVTAPDHNILIVLTPTPDLHPTPQWVNLYCPESYLDGYLLPIGTVVEALDQSGVVCGQFFVHEKGKYGFMPVYRDDATSPGVDEGADSNEVLIIHLNDAPASAFPTPVWTFNGDAQKICLNTEIIETRCFILKQGWNLISWNLDTPDDDVETLIADIKDCVDVILGFEYGAATYDPDFPQFSTLAYLDHFHGYWFRMDCEAELCITGTKVDPRSPIDLEKNWNLVSYLPDEADAVDHALGSIFDQLVVAFGFDSGAQTYDPAHPELSTLDQLKRDFGYWVKTTDAATLVYPGPAPISVHRGSSSMKASPPLTGVTPTPEWVDIFGSGVTLDGVLIPTGSHLEVYDESGVLCGAAIARENGTFDFAPIYRDDKSSVFDEGADLGLQLNLSINGIPVEESFTYTGFGDRIQLTELNSLTKSTATIPRNFSLSQNFPNPFNPSTAIVFDLPVSTRATVEVFSVLGTKVTTLVDRFLPAGRYTVDWNGTNADGTTVSSGIYLYRLTAGDFAKTRKMALIK